jgi:hypothetical protein
MFELKIWSLVFMAAALSWLAVPHAHAGTITMNFDDVVLPPDNNSYDATDYLEAHGITVTNVIGDSRWPSSGAPVITNPSLWNSEWAATDSAYGNVLIESSAGAPPVSYTMNFSTPLLSIGFTRIPTPPDLQTEAVWSATAYVGSQAVDSVGEGYGTWGNGSPANMFSLSGDGITSLTFSANGYYFTGIGAPPLDDFVMTTVPEPSTLALLGVCAGGLLTYVWRRRRAT